jgi:fructokinase
VKLEVEVERIEPVSTIGAGDTFNAGLAYGIWRKEYSKEQLSSLKASAWEELIGDAIRFSREVCLSYENYLPLETANRVRKKYQSNK